ncbi:hypothetical protein D3C71_1744370 [compost metagenome]
MHPAHVPFVVKAQAALGHWRGHARPGGGLFGHHDGVGRLFAHRGVQFAQEGHGFQVFAATVYVGDPFAGLAAVVAVEHGGHRVHAQPVNMKFPQPVHGAGDHEGFDFGAAQVVDQRVPVGVIAFARVGVFV